MIYFDNAATTLQKPPQVAEAVANAVNSLGNAGRGTYGPTLAAARLIYQTRIAVAKLFNAESADCIAFTSNATDGLNAVLQTLFTEHDHVISTAAEHNSVLRPLYLMQQKGLQLSFADVDEQGCVAVDGIEKLVRSNSKAVVISHISNVTGNSVDLQKISSICNRYGLLLIVDAAQSAGCIPIDVQKTGIDIMCFTGHKGLMGPQGTGGVYVRNGIAMHSFKVGGSGVHSFDAVNPQIMPDVLEPGTINTHGIAGLKEGVDFLLKTGVTAVAEKKMKLLKYFLAGINDIPQLKLYGEFSQRPRCAVVALNIADSDSAQISDILWERYGICVRGGIHCAPLLHQALKTSKQGMVRFSFGYYNTFEEVEKAVLALHELAADM